MRRVQIYLEESMDDALAAEAARRGTSKAALIRECISRRILADDRAYGTDDEIVGWIDRDVPDAGTIDDVVYRR